MKLIWLNRPDKVKLTENKIITKEKIYIFPKIEFDVIANILFVLFYKKRNKKSERKCLVIPKISDVYLCDLEYKLAVENYDLGRHFYNGLHKIYQKYDFYFRKPILRNLR